MAIIFAELPVLYKHTRDLIRVRINVHDNDNASSLSRTVLNPGVTRPECNNRDAMLKPDSQFRERYPRFRLTSPAPELPGL